MAGGIKECSSCRMFEARGISSAPEVCTCSKYNQLQLLKDCVKELEQQLDDLRSILGM